MLARKDFSSTNTTLMEFWPSCMFFFFLNEPPPPKISPFPLHDPLPTPTEEAPATEAEVAEAPAEEAAPQPAAVSEKKKKRKHVPRAERRQRPKPARDVLALLLLLGRSEEHTSELQSQSNLVCRLLLEKK